MSIKPKHTANYTFNTVCILKNRNKFIRYWEVLEVLHTNNKASQILEYITKIVKSIIIVFGIGVKTND